MLLRSGNGQDSNPRPTDHRSAVLPSEPARHPMLCDCVLYNYSVSDLVEVLSSCELRVTDTDSITESEELQDVVSSELVRVHSQVRLSAYLTHSPIITIMSSALFFGLVNSSPRLI